MRPVNITLDQDIRAKLIDPSLEEGRRRKRAPLEQRHSFFSEPHRRQV